MLNNPALLDTVLSLTFVDTMYKIYKYLLFLTLSDTKIIQVDKE